MVYFIPEMASIRKKAIDSSPILELVLEILLVKLGLKRNKRQRKQEE